MADKVKKPDEGHRRVRVTYSPDGFRGVKDLPTAEAARLVADKRAVYVPDDTPRGDDPPTNPAANTTSSAAPAGR